VCAQLHFNLCKEAGVKVGNEHQYKQIPKLVEISREGKVIMFFESAGAN